MSSATQTCRVQLFAPNHEDIYGTAEQGGPVNAEDLRTRAVKAVERLQQVADDAEALHNAGWTCRWDFDGQFACVEATPPDPME